MTCFHHLVNEATTAWQHETTRKTSSLFCHSMTNSRYRWLVIPPFPLWCIASLDRVASKSSTPLLFKTFPKCCNSHLEIHPNGIPCFWRNFPASQSQLSSSNPFKYTSGAGQAGGGSLERESNYTPKKELAYRMCAGWPNRVFVRRATNSTKSCAFHESYTATSPNAALATKSEAPKAPSIVAPATKSDAQTSPNAALATKSDAPTSPNVAPAAKSNILKSPSIAPATKRDIRTSPNVAPATQRLESPNIAPATKSHSPTSPNVVLATKSDTATSALRKLTF